MAKNSQSEQLDRLVNAILSRPAAPPPKSSAKLTPLARIAASLRSLPRQDFKERLKSELEGRSSMSSVAKPAPEVRTTASPRLTFNDAAKAIDFYKRAFGARETFRFEVGGGVAHAEIAIGDSSLFLAEEWPEGGRFSAETLGNSPVWLSIRVPDVDAFAQTAIAAGMKVKRPIQDQFYGSREVLLADPFGYTWSVFTVKEQMSVEEMHRRLQRETAQSGTEKTIPADAERERGGAVPYIREGFRTVTPYILVPGASQFIEFLKAAFGGVEKGRVPLPNGKIMHAEVKLGDSMIELSDGNDQYSPTPVAIHHYVDDVDATYARALEAGAISTHAPVDQPYGDREAGVKDPFGNSWFIAKAIGWTPQPWQARSVQPYLFLHDAEKMVSFLESAFGARAEGVHKSPEGVVAHAAVRIGDATIEFSEAHGPYQPSLCHLHLYVPDTDAVYAQALRAGAATIESPVDKPYGDRSAGVRDAWGNSWFIATHIKDVAF
jgi:PhnB protein